VKVQKVQKEEILIELTAREVKEAVADYLHRKGQRFVTAAMIVLVPGPHAPDSAAARVEQTVEKKPSKKKPLVAVQPANADEYKAGV